MIFGRGPADDGPAPEAVYARVLDGAHLWLAVRDAGAHPLRLGDTDVPTEPDGELRSAVLPLAPAFSTGPDDLALTTARGTPVRTAYLRPDGPTLDVAPGGGFEVLDVDGAVVVRRTGGGSGAAGVDVTGFAVDDERVRVTIAHPGPVPVVEVQVVQGGTVVGVLPVVGGGFDLDDVPGLDAGRPATFRAGGAPLVRARNVLARPNAAVLLPPLAAGLELRWQPGGRLALQRKDV